jgi:hypothetical protein
VPAEVAAFTGHVRKTQGIAAGSSLRRAARQRGLESPSPMQPCCHDDVVPKISSKDLPRMAPRPLVTKHPFTLMFVVIALVAPFAGLAWRTRDWVGW